MAFRQKYDAWSAFVRQHREALLACGLPAEIYQERLRLLVFLEHGYDDWGRAEHRHAAFHADSLTDQQLAALADFVAAHFGPTYHAAVLQWRKT